MNIISHPIYSEYFAYPETGEVFSTKQGRLRKIKPETINTGYKRFVITENGKVIHYLVSRFVYECATRKPLNDREIDHKDLNKSNNSIDNLRVANDSLNSIHRPKYKKGKYSSQYIGVAWDKQRNKWHAYLSVNGKKHCAGFFDSEEEAAKARNRLAVAFVKPGYYVLNEVA
jgi:hypothetical protein